jgi:LysM repeat protein
VIKKGFLVFTALVWVFVCWNFSSIYAAAETIVSVNNLQIQESVKATYHDSVAMFPAKELMGALGGNFSYDNSTMTGILRQGGNEIVFRLDNSIVKLNGKYIKSSAPMKIINNRLCVPVEFVSKNLGSEVYVDSNRNTMMIFRPVDGKLLYKVQRGDSLWLISKIFGTGIDSIMKLNMLSDSTIYVGQQLIIKNMVPYSPEFKAYTSSSATVFSQEELNSTAVGYLKAWTEISITGKNGNWYRATTPKGKGYVYSSVISINQDLNDNAPDSLYFNNIIPVDTSNNFITYMNYTIRQGDTLWSIATNYNIPVDELISYNKIPMNTVLYPGGTIKIPVHNIPVKEKTAPNYGEILDWFKEAQYIFSINKTGKFTDLETGVSFMAKRTVGASHEDVETLTVSDTQKMKAIFGGGWTWNKRPFSLEVDGRTFAVSVSGMPHAGVDWAPFLENVYNRSDGWGYGPNYDSIKGNGMDGHFDVYFLNCLRHVDNKIDSTHQANVLISGGLR